MYTYWCYSIEVHCRGPLDKLDWLRLKIKIKNLFGFHNQFHNFSNSNTYLNRFNEIFFQVYVLPSTPPQQMTAKMAKQTAPNSFIFLQFYLINDRRSTDKVARISAFYIVSTQNRDTIPMYEYKFLRKPFELLLSSHAFRT